MKKVLKYTLIVAGWIILGIITLLLLASLLLQTRPVKNKLANVAENQAEKFIDGNLSIGKIDGNFFTGLVVENILLTLDNDTLASIAKLDLSYNLLPLIEGTIEVSNAHISQPYFYLEQYPDSTWNFQQLIQPAEKAADTASGGGLALSFPDIRIENGNIETNTLDTVIPQEVQTLNIHASFELDGSETAVEMKEFNMSTVQPDFELTHLEFFFRQNSSFYELNNFHLKTQMNQLTAEANLESEPPQNASAHIESDTLHLNEFEYFIPNFKIPANPNVLIDGEMHADSLVITLELQDGNQRISLNASSSNLAALLFDNLNDEPNYNLEGRLENINLAHWLGNPELNYMINGDISAEGRGFDPANAEILVKADLGRSVAQDRSFNELLIDLEMTRGNLSGVVSGNADFGEFRIEPDIQNLLETPVYEARIETEDFNLARVLKDDSLSSNINLTAYITGESFEPEEISATAEVEVSKSRFQEIEIDTLFTMAAYEANNLQIDTLRVQAQNTLITANGNYNLNGPSDVRLNAEFGGLEVLQPFVDMPEVQTSGNLNAHLTGTTDSLNLNASLSLDSTAFDEMTLQELQLDADGIIDETDTLFNASLTAINFVTGEFQLDSVSAQVEGTPDSLYVNAGVSNSDLNTQISTGFEPGETMRFRIDSWQIEYKNQLWALQQPSIIRIDSIAYEVEDFRLATNDADTAQFIAADGIITRQGNEDFTLEISNINISKLSETLEQDFNAEGILDLALDIEGTAGAPTVKGDFNISDAKMNDYDFTRFEGSLDFANEEVNFESFIIPQDSGRFNVSATLPLQLNLDTMGFYFDPEAAIDGQVVIDSFSLAVLETLDLGGDITGFIQGKVDVTGTVEEPNPTGNIRLVDASLRVEEYGIDYRTIALSIEFLKNRLQIDTLHIVSDDGDLNGSGSIDFGSAFYNGDVSQSQIELNFDEFNLLDHDQFNMQVSGNASLGGETGNVVYGGDLRVSQAEINLPAVLGMLGRMSTPEMPKPLLVRHAERMGVSLDSLGIQTFEIAQRDSVSFDYLNNFEGQLRVRIPGNTWIKNEDMRLEISGELELIKNQEFFELFGSVEVVRGQYDLLGKTFVINQGSINFQGGEELVPRLNIEAVYSFRNPERAEQEITVQITGTTESPEIEFLLDGNSISEGDALSYILFGKNMNALTMNEQQNVESAGGGSVAERAAASVISSQISSFLGDKLNVDFIEVKSEGSFENASVVVGKYITNDLFVSYEQRFGEVDEKDLAKYEVMAEYELFRFLFFELNNSSTDSGFDVIVKFDVK